MRILFSIVGLLVVVLVIGILTKKQLAAVAPSAAPATVSGAPAQAPLMPASQVRQTVEGMLQQPRPGMGDEK